MLMTSPTSFLIVWSFNMADMQFIHTDDINDIQGLRLREEESIKKAQLYSNKNGLMLNAKRLTLKIILKCTCNANNYKCVFLSFIVLLPYM